jgi:tetratricopeptide (TPR) repeat protein
MNFSHLFIFVFVVVVISTAGEVSSSSSSESSTTAKTSLYDTFEEHLNTLTNYAIAVKSNAAGVRSPSPPPDIVTIVTECNETRKVLEELHTSPDYFRRKDSKEFAGMSNQAGVVMVDAGCQVDGINFLREALEMRQRIADAAWLEQESRKKEIQDIIDAEVGDDEKTRNEVAANELRKRLNEQQNKNYKKKDPTTGVVLDEDVAQSLTDYGLGLDKLRRHDEALLTLQAALKMRRRLFGANPGDKRGNRLLSASLINLADSMSARGQYENALDFLHEALDILKQLNHKVDNFGNSLGAHPYDHSEVGHAISKLARAYAHSGKQRRALELHQEAMEMHKRLYDDRTHSKQKDNQRQETENNNKNPKSVFDLAHSHAEIAGIIASLHPANKIDFESRSHREEHIKHQQLYMDNLLKSIAIRRAGLESNAHGNDPAEERKLADFLIYVSRTLTYINMMSEKEGKKLVHEASKIYTKLKMSQPPEVVEGGGVDEYFAELWTEEEKVEAEKNEDL